MKTALEELIENLINYRNNFIEHEDLFSLFSLIIEKLKEDDTARVRDIKVILKTEEIHL